MKFCKIVLFQCHKILKRKVTKDTESNRLNLFLQIRGIVEKDLGYLFITSSSCHFFKKTVLEQYLIQAMAQKYQNQAEIINVKQPMQGRNNVTRVQVELSSWYQGFSLKPTVLKLKKTKY